MRKYEVLDSEIKTDSVTTSTMKNFAKATASSNPQEIISESVKTVEKIGLQTLQEIDHSRLKLREKTQQLQDEDEEIVHVIPQGSRLMMLRSSVPVFI